MIDSLKSRIYKIIDYDSYNKNNIIFSISLLNKNKKDLCVLHIYNPNREELIINKNNKKFYEKVANMLFVNDIKNKEKGCFNHQMSDDSIIYNKNMSLSKRLNGFIKIQYTFILIDIQNKKLNPVSLFCLIDNYIYDVCTSYYHRNMGYMTKLLLHFFDLVKYNKLKNGKYEYIKLDIVNINPNFRSIKDYYEKKFNFKILEKQADKIIMQKKI